MTDFAVQQIILVKQNNMAECMGEKKKIINQTQMVVTWSKTLRHLESTVALP